MRTSLATKPKRFPVTSLISDPGREIDSSAGEEDLSFFIYFGDFLPFCFDSFITVFIINFSFLFVF
jgi:hypothetical protein